MEPFSWSVPPPPGRMWHADPPVVAFTFYALTLFNYSTFGFGRSPAMTAEAADIPQTTSVRGIEALQI